MKRFFPTPPAGARRLLLPLTVFLTGAALLVIEVAAMRILSPYFGNTLYSTSSILGVVLGALSIGYYFGGRLADRHPSARLFYTIILISGILTFALQLLALLVLPSIGYSLPISSGPLLMSLLMFLLPGISLGMLSPFAVKLQAARFPKVGTGSVAGEIFFWSTLGSIVGSLTTGFVWVPFFGLNATIIATAIFLSLLGAIPLLFQSGLPGRRVKQLLLAAFLLAGLTVGLTSATASQALYVKDGLYEKITIYDASLYDENSRTHRPARFLQQDRSSSSAMFLDGDDLAYRYTKYYALYKGIKPDASRSLVIGGAAYSIPKALLADSAEMRVDVAEIEPSLFELSKQYFNVQSTPRLTNHLIDGRRLLATTDQRYDLIFSDVYYSLYSIPSHFTTKEFMQLSKDKLRPGGVFVANLIGSLAPDQPSFILSQIKTIQSVYPQVHVFAVDSNSSQQVQNIIMVGVNDQRPVDFTAPAFTASQDATLRSLASKRVDLSQLDLSQRTIFTDNYAPVEYYVSQTVAN